MSESKQVKYVPIKEFRELGFLQEANRLFFHPLGLALEVRIAEDGTEAITGVWDSRDDPEGIAFIDLADPVCQEKADRVEAERQRHVVARQALLGGSEIQPIGSMLASRE